MPEKKKFNPIENLRKKDPDPERTTKNVHLNIRQYRMLERLMEHWKCNASETIRRLIAPTVEPVLYAIVEKKEEAEIKYELPMDRKFWGLLERHNWGSRP